LKIFLEAVQAQVGPEANLIKDVLAGVLAGTAPASLPKQTEPVKPTIVEKPVTERMFTMRVVRWVDAQGVPQIADQYTDADLTAAAAETAGGVMPLCRSPIPVAAIFAARTAAAIPSRALRSTW
jgi:hypothetical protein